MSKTLVQEDPTAKAATAYEAILRAAEAQDAGPEWLRARRAAARDAFRTHGIPHPRLEGFRQTDLGAIRTHAWPVPAAPGDVTEADLAALRWDGAAAEIVVVDGHVVPHLSRVDDAAIALAPLAQVLAEDPDGIEPYLTKVVAQDGPEETLRALNTALFVDGACLFVSPRAVVRAPIHVLHVTTARATPHAVHPRLLVLMGGTAEATVIESYAGLGTNGWVNVVTELVLEPGAVLDHVKVQDEPLGAHHTMALGAHVARDAKLRALAVAFGAAVSRTDLTVRLAQGAEAHLNGLFLARGTQHVDHHTWIDHAEPHGTSLEVFKGILDGRARGVFTGNILVRPGAQKTNSDLENRNLILSREALVDTTPQLEIHADDVKCAHGTTIGRLPPEQIFYLRSRGLDDEEARRVLTEAFAADLFETQAPSIQERLRARLAAWFETRKEAA